MRKYRWTIVGTGHIANRFAKGLKEVEDAVLEAVVSRNVENGKKFAELYGCEKAYTVFEELLREGNTDIVYIGIPNDCHYSYIMKALDAGVHVLCEKPMADNEKQLKEILARAKEKNLFVMEGMWTRCFPVIKVARKWLCEGRIGAPLSVKGEFDIQPVPEAWQPWKGGIEHAAGALRDVGIYALALAFMVFPQGPEKVFSTMKSNGQADESFHMFLDYGDGRAAFLGGSFNQISSSEGEIVGENGRILLGPKFWRPTRAELILNDGTKEVFEEEYVSTGFQFEIRRVQECISEKRIECPEYTWEETEKITELIEETRKKWGIIYASDK